MKSNCCQASMFVESSGVSDNATRFYRCVECGKACDPETVSTVTETTYKNFRRGVLEGFQIAINEIEEMYDANLMATMSCYEWNDEIIEKIHELIKKYSGEE